MPVHQNLRYGTREAALSAGVGRLRLAVCAGCGFIHNAAFDPALLRYEEHYENDQGYSDAFRAHLDALVGRVLGRVQDGVVVEVGCGQGQFLRRLVAEPGSRAVGHGFDPSYRGPEVAAEGRLRFQRALYGPEHVVADALLCRHVIEHIPDPGPFLAGVARALGAAADPRVYFETPDIGWILDHRVYFDVFYEHCSYFTPASLRTAFERAGFAVSSVERVFGGQYLWLEAGRGDGAPAACDPGDAVARALAYGAAEVQWRTSAAHALQAFEGPVAVWGAGAKGATYASLLDPDHRHIACVVDINPGKQGAFLPMSGHPVVAPEALVALGVRTVVLMNPNYRAEVAASLAALSPTPPVLVDA